MWPGRQFAARAAAVHYCRMKSLCTTGVMALFLVAAGCGDSSTPPATDGGGSDLGGRDLGSADGGRTDGGSMGRVPVTHRAMAAECGRVRGPGNADPGGGGACTSDAMCTTGINGRCLRSTGGALTFSCSYDECFVDGECGASEVCRCREAPSDANVCVSGNCVLDADCGAGGYCSPSRGFDRINLGVSGFWCHTAMDECVDDADCTVDAGPTANCTWFPDRDHWACSTQGFFPP